MVDGEGQPELEVVFDQGTLVLRTRGGGTADQRRLRPGAGWVWDPRVTAWRCDAGRYPDALGPLAKRFGPTLAVDVLRAPGVDWPAFRLPPLRADQRAALDAWEAGGRRGLVVMPTGTGKTEVALAAMAGARCSTLVVAPVRELVRQWQRRIRSGLGLAPGVIGDGTFEPRTVTVTTYDSAARHMSDLGHRFRLVVFDEAHHLPAPFFREAALRCAAPFRLGLTATPERGDGRENDLAALVGPTVYRQELPEARGRTLAEYDVVRLPVALSGEERLRHGQAARTVRRFMAERLRRDPRYRWQDAVAAAVSDPAARAARAAWAERRRIEDQAEGKLALLEDLFVLHAHERVLVFAGTNAMALEVSRRFLIPALLHHTGRFERAEVIGGFARGEFRAVVANRVLDEGVDVPAAKVAVVLGGLASTRQAKQRLGRILRRSGSARAVLYEVVCARTGDEERSRTRRRSDAYARTGRRPR